MTAEAFTCPSCGKTSHNPGDVREGYCGRCHAWTRDECEHTAGIRLAYIEVQAVHGGTGCPRRPLRCEDCEGAWRTWTERLDECGRTCWPGDYEDIR